MMVLRPVFTVGFLAAAWTQERGGVPEIRRISSAASAPICGRSSRSGSCWSPASRSRCWRPRWSTAAAARTASRGARNPTRRSRRDGRCRLAMLFAVVCALPTLLAVWFAPALVVFQDCSTAQALLREPARRGRQLARGRRLRPDAVLLRRRAARSRDRPHRVPRAAGRGAVGGRADGAAALRIPVRRRADTSPTTSRIATSSIRPRTTRRRRPTRMRAGPGADRRQPDCAGPLGGRSRPDCPTALTAASSFAYSSASHLTPDSRKLTCTRASPPRPSASMMMPRPNFAWRTLWPMRQPGAPSRMAGAAAAPPVGASARRRARPTRPRRPRSRRPNGGDAARATRRARAAARP